MNKEVRYILRIDYNSFSECKRFYFESYEKATEFAKDYLSNYCVDEDNSVEIYIESKSYEMNPVYHPDLFKEEDESSPEV